MGLDELMMRDAAPYRWLRDPCVMLARHWYGGSNGVGFALDAAIDSACGKRKAGRRRRSPARKVRFQQTARKPCSPTSGNFARDKGSDRKTQPMRGYQWIYGR